MKGIVSILITVVSLSVLVFIFWRLIPSIVQVIMTIDLKIIFMTIGVYLLALYISSIRLQKVFKSYGINGSINKFFVVTMIGQFFNNILPTSIGGDSVKAIYAANQEDKISEAFFATIIDRAVGFAAVGICVTLGIFIFPEITKNTLLHLSMSVIGFGIVVLAVIFYSKQMNDRITDWVARLPYKWGSSLAGALEVTSSFFRNRKIVVYSLIISVIILAVFAFAIYLIAYSIGINLKYGLSFLLILMVSLFSLIPSINGTGVREGTFIFVLGNYVSYEKAIAMSIIFLGVGVFCSLFGAIFFIWRHRFGIKMNPYIKSNILKILKN